MKDNKIILLSQKKKPNQHQSNSLLINLHLCSSLSIYYKDPYYTQELYYAGLILQSLLSQRSC